jgi:microcompartment protein CcmL/EutN
VNKIWSTLVIPRPHDEIEKLINSLDTVGNFKETEKSENEDIEVEDSSEVKEVEEETKEELIEEKVEEKIDNVYLNKSDKNICNICGDPKCPRKKGEPRALCIHNKK